MILSIETTKNPVSPLLTTGRVVVRAICPTCGFIGNELLYWEHELEFYLNKGIENDMFWTSCVACSRNSCVMELSR